MVKSYFAQNEDLFARFENGSVAALMPWKPRALTHTEWPPNYKGVFAWRLEQLAKLRANPEMLKSAKAYYKTRPAEFIMHWMDTFDPRRKGSKWIPFVFFTRQEEYIRFLNECIRDDENGLTEKCRDMGATWLACAYTVHQWLFVDNDAIGWGSRKQELVDKIGDVSSIFEKLRMLVRRLPDVWRPVGLVESKHLTFMKMLNPENGAVITGETGDNIGRGGRTRFYLKDEAQPLSAGILTPDGWKTMGDMCVGSLVYGSNGNIRLVTAINNAGIHQVYRIGFSDGTTAECSENHLWSVNKVQGTKKQLILNTSEIAKTFKYKAPGGQYAYIYRIPTTKPVVFSVKKYSLHPYIVGALLGDGSIADVPKGSVSFTSADVEIVSAIEQRLPIGCKITKQASSPYAYRIVDIRGRQGNKKENRSRARKAVVDAGIAGCNSWEKFIPDDYKFGLIDDRIELLQGLMDTDGSASGGTTTYHTSSRRLADDVRFIVQSLGGSCSLNTKPDHRGYRDIYTLHISLPEYILPFKLTRKLQSHRIKKQPFGKTIVSVEAIGKQEVRCITIDAADGLYLTDHCIVTHNSAHYERPEKIEAALGDNTNTQLDISSVNGLGNVFHRKREAGIDWRPGAANLMPGFTRIFIFDWSHHPEKTQAWYDQRKAKAIREGMQHVFAQEVDRNYSAAVSNTIISYEWIVAAVDAHKKIRWRDDKGVIQTGIPDAMIGGWGAGLDVGDDGIDRNALALHQGIIWRDVEEWGERDPGVTARRAIARCRQHPGIKVQYDSIGIGSAVKSEYNRLLIDEKIIAPNEVQLIGWNAGFAVVNPFYHVIADDDQSPMNKDFFHNFKAQAWWSLRTRFYKTWNNIRNGVIYDINELISLDSMMPLLQQLMKELAQPTSGPSASSLRMVVEKKPDGTKSPNLADAGVMMYFPVLEIGGASVGAYGY